MKLFKSYIRRTSYNRHPKAKLLALGAGLFSLGAVTSIATTYAWYTINVLAQIDNIDVRITAQKYFDKYYLKFDLEPLHGDTRTKYYDDYLDENGKFNGYSFKDMGYDGDVKIHDVSGMFENDWNNTNTNSQTALPKFKTIKGATSGNSAQDADDMYYLQTVLWLYSNANCDIYLSPESGIVSNENKNKATATDKNGELDEDKYKELLKVTNTIRISFYSEDGYEIISAKSHDSEKDTYYGGILDLDGDGYYDYSEGREVLYGEYKTKPDGNYYDIAGPLPEEPKYSGNTFEAEHHPGIEKFKLDKPEKIRTDATLDIAKEDSHDIEEYRCK